MSRSHSSAATILSLLVVSTACRSAAELPTAEELSVVETESSVPMCSEVGRQSADAVSPLRVDTLATGMAVPWDLTFLPDGRALVTERPGRVRIVTAGGRLDPEPWIELDVYAQEEVGLMGIDWRHDDSGNVDVYVATTYRPTPSGQLSRLARGAWNRLLRRVDPERGHPTTLRVLRIPMTQGGRAGEPEVVISGLPAFMLHGGGALRFGPDGLLYVTNGDGTEPWTAHDPRSMRGKILRYHPDGRPAGAEAGSPVFARGIRHIQGLAWHPETGDLFAIDHGPSGMEQEDYRGNRDELNVVEAGDHLGWPIVTGTTEGGPFESALMYWTPAIAPAGLDLYLEDGPWAGSALVTGLRGEALRRIEMARDPDGSWSPGCEEIVFQQDFGRLRLVRVAPDGTVWMSTSNGDGRGVPRPDGDLLLRVHAPR